MAISAHAPGGAGDAASLAAPSQQANRRTGALVSGADTHQAYMATTLTRIWFNSLPPGPALRVKLTPVLTP